jgi:thiol-disulfide isomerase/thioredoxin
MKIIDKNIYILKSGKILVTHTASWCGPCNRIKPYFYSLMKDIQPELYNVDSTDSKTLNDELIDFNSVFVPIPNFIIFDKNKNYETSIQTSKNYLLYEFLKKYI